MIKACQFLSLSLLLDPAIFRQGLSNGFIVGEILRKYGVISDDQLIALGHNFTGATKRKNMAHIHEWIIGAGMTALDLSDLLDVAEVGDKKFLEFLSRNLNFLPFFQEKPGAIVRLLYKLYFLLERGGRSQQGQGQGQGDYLAEVDPSKETDLPPNYEDEVEDEEEGEDLEDQSVEEEGDNDSAEGDLIEPDDLVPEDATKANNFRGSQTKEEMATLLNSCRKIDFSKLSSDSERHDLQKMKGLWRKLCAKIVLINTSFIRNSKIGPRISPGPGNGFFRRHVGRGSRSCREIRGNPAYNRLSSRSWGQNPPQKCRSHRPFSHFHEGCPTIR